MERRLLAGRYELQEQVGESSWRATDTELGRDVLVRLGGDVDAGAALSHQGIVRVFDQGEEDGERFAVLEYLSGGTLAERGSLSAAAAADVAAALAYAHEQGVAHGALDAEAILFDAEGRAKLAGFRGEGDPAADLAALDALRGETEVTAVAPALAAEEPPARPRRRPLALLLVAAALVAAGIAAAFLAASDDSPAEDPTTSASVSRPTTGTTAETEPSPAPTEETTTATTETQPPTTTSDTQPPPSTVELPTTAPPLPTLPPTEPITEEPPLPTEPPPTTEVPPPPTTTIP